MSIKRIPLGSRPRRRGLRGWQGRAARRPSPPVWLGSALALGAGLAVAWIDTRPGWDDTGVTAGMLLIAAAAAAMARVPPWLAAVLVVAPILVAELPGGLGVLLAIPFVLAGAFLGTFLRRRIPKR